MKLLRTPIALLWVACLILAGCASEPDRPLMTLGQQLRATQPGFEGVRFFVDDRQRNILPQLHDLRPSVSPTPSYLALSGGGEGGAFGAGVLIGWTQSGTRPQFDLVTGISAGALIAPFAFIGADADPVLQELFEGGIASRLNAPPSILSAILGEGLLEAAPLREMIAFYIDETVMNRIAARHRQGARLLVVTTNIDAERNVAWDMGAIAASGRPDAKDLFVDILAASASIPAVFPPVAISSTVDGVAFDELHVDGGAIRQIYLFPEAFIAKPIWRDMGTRRPRLYAIANNEVAPRFEPVKAHGIALARGAFSSLVKSSLVQSLTKLEEFATDNGMQFRLMYINQYIESDDSKPFDPNYMRTAFALGEYLGRRQAWVSKVPIGTDLLSARLAEDE